MSVINRMLNELEKQRKKNTISSRQSLAFSYLQSTTQRYYFNLVMAILIIILLIAFGAIILIKHHRSNTSYLPKFPTVTSTKENVNLLQQ